ncbi:class A beta-lactamase-related serine hydrolase [Ktedonosporobacter rubrisoli]|uniref:Class A beta-lactamase-related serine hydrolase n=1 Tax=Ktedonosporobacter rubrisoli TaxID=2509675 RepID=A0A4P6JZB8_KTERU|nr:serine hydrolase domain-containing protein [Ktedonosporobacter rubrisoli]QBD80842.1 class A beta-lactamase-related serine hydrolase [Ktedonosporobacter rubrisoli]
MTVSLQGNVEPRFTSVRDEFQSLFEQGHEVGAALCVYQHGKPVLDLWAGLANQQAGVPWQHDTLSWLASASKGMVAASALLLVERGLLDLDAPVSRYWPEFAAEGKAAIPVRWLLSHRSGVAALDKPISYEDEIAYTPIIEAIAAQRPWWKPGTAHGYHALTIGWAISEVIRRITGLTIGQFFAQEIAAPLGLELYIGLPEALTGRVASVVVPTQEEMARGLTDPALAAFSQAMVDPGSLLYKATFAATTLTFEDVNNPQYYAAEDPAGGGLGTATSLARLYATLIGEVDGTRLLRPELVEQARNVESSGLDQVLRIYTLYGLGFMLPGSGLWPDFGARAFGHAGSTGALGFADPEHALAFGYVTNKMTGLVEGNDERTTSLIRSLYSCLAP